MYLLPAPRLYLDQSLSLSRHERSRVKRWITPIAVLSLVAAACGDASGDDAIASVNGVEITRARIERIVPTRGGDILPDEFARYVGVMIQWEAVAQAAESEFGIVPTEEDVDARLNELVAGIGAGATLEAYLSSVDASEAGIREFARQLVVQSGVETSLADAGGLVSDDAVSQELFDNALDWTVVCVSHILVETEDEAIVARSRIVSGEDFAAVASEVSLDRDSGADGGDLGCGSPSNYTGSVSAATMEAEINVPTQPVESEAGFHVILVSQREEATLDIVRASLEREALALAVEDWFDAVIERAEVTVDESVGVWLIDPTPRVVASN